MNTPLISIIIAVYNGRETLQRCLDSILGQTFKTWELIVIDGGSTDGTVEILQNYREHLAYWVSEPDRGIYHAWNKALDHVSGEWVLFLGADDYLLKPDSLRQVQAYLSRALPSCRVIYAQVLQADRSGEQLRVIGEPWEKAKKYIRNFMTIPHPATFHHRTLFEEHGKFNEIFQIAGDYEFLLRELLNKPACFADTVQLVAMQIGGLSASPANGMKLLRETRLARRMHGLTEFSSHYWLGIARLAVRTTLEKVLGQQVASSLLDWWRKATGRKPYWTKV